MSDAGKPVSSSGPTLTAATAGGGDRDTRG